MAGLSLRAAIRFHVWFSSTDGIRRGTRTQKRSVVKAAEQEPNNSRGQGINSSLLAPDYLDRLNLCHMVSAQPITRNAPADMVVAAGRLQYSDDTGLYTMSTNTTPRTLKEDTADIRSKALFIAAEDSFHKRPDFFSVTVIAAGGVERTMCVDKPSVSGQAPFGVDRMNTERNEFNTAYLFEFILHECYQDPRTGRLTCAYNICTSDSETRTCLKAYENGTCTFEILEKGDESDPRFGWFLNTFGVRDENPDATEDRDLEEENMDPDDQVQAASSEPEAGAGGDGDGTAPAADGSDAPNGTSDTGSSEAGAGGDGNENGDGTAPAANGNGTGPNNGAGDTGGGTGGTSDANDTT
ncbi:hypothetical protein C8R46DRAFT_1035037 [Mycena filopes]|nr:hypothetical protein C8R46DRAFT_1035037 [Mycena filopes]